MVCFVPKFWVTRPARRINVIDALRHHRAPRVEMQFAELVLGLRQEPLAVFRPTLVVPAPVCVPPPLVLLSFDLALIFFVRFAVARAATDDCRATSVTAEPLCLVSHVVLHVLQLLYARLPPLPNLCACPFAAKEENAANTPKVITYCYTTSRAAPSYPTTRTTQPS